MSLPKLLVSALELSIWLLTIVLAVVAIAASLNQNIRLTTLHMMVNSMSRARQVRFRKMGKVLPDAPRRCCLCLEFPNHF